jgi:F-type H+-transporting ATPase subunit c
MNPLQLIAASLAIGLAGIGAGIAMSFANGRAYEAIGRNPEAFDRVRTVFVLGLILSETIAIYGLVMSMLILFHS